MLKIVHSWDLPIFLPHSVYYKMFTWPKLLRSLNNGAVYKSFIFRGWSCIKHTQYLLVKHFFPVKYFLTISVSYWRDCKSCAVNSFFVQITEQLIFRNSPFPKWNLWRRLQPIRSRCVNPLNNHKILSTNLTWIMSKIITNTLYLKHVRGYI